jgi:hypothetical protein
MGSRIAGMGSRIVGAVVLALLACSAASAQSTLPAPPTVPLNNPLPPPMNASRPDLFLATPDTYAPHHDHQARAPFTGFFYGPWGPYPAWAGPVRRHTSVVSNGYLALQVQPAQAQVYVDGLYVGTVNDVVGALHGRPLEAGAHRLELRAPGYDGIAVDVRIDPGQTTLYRGELTPARTPPAPVVAPAATPRPKTFYVISGCYAGDKRPEIGRLPRGCDASKLREVPPLVNRIDRRPHS